jgi:hypothetical protein
MPIALYDLFPGVLKCASLGQMPTGFERSFSFTTT